MFVKNGNIFNLWIRTVFCGRLLCVESFSAIEYGCNTINAIDVLLTVGISTLVMILDVKGCKMQIMFIRVVCGRIILRCLIVKTIIFDKCFLWSSAGDLRCVCSETRL